jgi:glycosyltransferase involved in cell wall biosynthesis
LVVGKTGNEYGQYLIKKFRDSKYIKFLGAIYDIGKLNNLRYYSNLYFHGHTVGGTNPSLLEAMASKALVSANDNIFNRSILGDDGIYFKNSDDVASHLRTISKSSPEIKEKIERNATKITHEFSWPYIVDQYVQHFENILSSRKEIKVRTSIKDLEPRLVEKS